MFTFRTKMMFENNCFCSSIYKKQFSKIYENFFLFQNWLNIKFKILVNSHEYKSFAYNNVCNYSLSFVLA